MENFVKKEGKENTGDFRSDSNFLLGYFEKKDNGLYYRYDAERVIVEAWGDNSLRVRASKMPQMPQELWALEGKPEINNAKVVIGEYSAQITNGKIKAVINNIGKITFYNQKGEVLLEEYVRNREDMFADTCSSLEVEAREFKPIIGGDYKLTMRAVPAKVSECKRCGVGTGAPQFPGQRTFCPFLTGIWIFVEQPGHRACEL